MGVKGLAYMVSRGHGLGLLSPRGSRGRPTESQGAKGQAYKFPGVNGYQGSRDGQGGPMGSTGRPTGTQGVNKYAYRVQGGPGVEKGARGFQGIKGGI